MKTWDYYSGQARKRLAPVVASGEAVCGRCRRLIDPSEPWDVGHVISIDIDPDMALDPGNQRPEHRRCNRSAGARYGNRKRRGKRSPDAPYVPYSPFPPASREW